ncbi:hypothetical protein BROUX41_004831 [Berkeleyomyces rouxiae]
MVQVLVPQQLPRPSTSDDVSDTAAAVARAILGGSSLSHSAHPHPHNHGHGLTLRHAQPSNLSSIQEAGAAPSQTIAEKRSARAGVRAPRRSQSLSEYDNEQPPVRHVYLPSLPPTLPSPTTSTPAPPSPAPRAHHLSAVQENGSVPASPVTSAPSGTPGRLPPNASVSVSTTTTLALRMVRPKPRKPPRRAFSLMDDEPVVHTHRPSERVSLLDLPTDIHFAIFDFLDPIDSVCFGLSSRVFYPIHFRLNGRVSLASRRHGPNTLEWAWRGAGSLRHPGLSPPQSPMPCTTALASGFAPGTPPGSGFPGLTNPQTSTTTVSKPSNQPQSPSSSSSSAASRAAIRLDGQVYCRKCGTSRCELHSHLKQWMGSDMEYCSVSCRFGRPAPPGARDVCYRRSPKNPSRCGRHAPRVRASAPVSPRMRPVDMDMGVVTTKEV